MWYVLCNSSLFKIIFSTSIFATGIIYCPKLDTDFVTVLCDTLALDVEASTCFVKLIQCDLSATAHTPKPGVITHK